MSEELATLKARVVVQDAELEMLRRENLSLVTQLNQRLPFLRFRRSHVAAEL
jgi:hypothetical protein